MGRSDLVKHTIDTGDSRPINQSPRRFPAHMTKYVDALAEDMLARNGIEPSCGPWSSGIVLVKNKDGTSRFCVDYHRLNSDTLNDAY